MKDDPYYLVEYASILAAYDSYKEAEVILKQTLKLQTNSVLYDRLGYTYFKNQKYKEAEQAN